MLRTLALPARLQSCLCALKRGSRLSIAKRGPGGSRRGTPPAEVHRTTTCERMRRGAELHARL
eukprot:14447783-Alexandrium_andersonii.AAC.1